MATGFWRFENYIIPLNITIYIPCEKNEKKKPNPIKVWLFNIKWNWKNRKWKKCRAKIRAYERDYIKRVLKS